MLNCEKARKVVFAVSLIMIFIISFLTVTILIGDSVEKMRTNETKPIDIQILPTQSPVDPFGYSKTASSVTPLSKEETEKILASVMNDTLTKP